MALFVCFFVSLLLLLFTCFGWGFLLLFYLYLFSFYSYPFCVYRVNCVLVFYNSDVIIKGFVLLCTQRIMYAAFCLAGSFVVCLV